MKCPGQDSQYWTADAIYEVPCPNCGAPVEFFKDDSARICSACKTRFANPKLDFGCAAYCPHASMCVGVQEGQKREQSLKEVLMQEVNDALSHNQVLWRKLRLLADTAEAMAREEGVSVFTVLGLSYLRALDENVADRICRLLEEKKIEMNSLRLLLEEKNLQRIEWQIIEDAEKIVIFSSEADGRSKKELKNLVGLCHTESGRKYCNRFDKD